MAPSVSASSWVARRMPPLTVMGWLRFDALRRVLRSEAPRRVLEIGCGEGAMGAWMARTCRYVGVEPDPSSRAVAARRVGVARDARICASLDDVPEGAFDLVAAFEVLEHLEDDVAALTRWREFLLPGGAIVLSVPAHPARYGASDELVGHFRRYARGDLVARLERAGYTVGRIEPYGAGLGQVLDRVQDRIAARRIRSARASDAVGPRYGTPGSGRYLQPESTPAAAARSALAAPFRVAQAGFRRSDVGSGYVVSARAHPASA